MEDEWFVVTYDEDCKVLLRMVMRGRPAVAKYVASVMPKGTITLPSLERMSKFVEYKPLSPAVFLKETLDWDNFWLTGKAVRMKSIAIARLTVRP